MGAQEKGQQEATVGLAVLPDGGVQGVGVDGLGCFRYWGRSLGPGSVPLLCISGRTRGCGTSRSDLASAGPWGAHGEAQELVRGEQWRREAWPERPRLPIVTGRPGASASAHALSASSPRRGCPCHGHRHAGSGQPRSPGSLWAGGFREPFPLRGCQSGGARPLGSPRAGGAGKTGDLPGLCSYLSLSCRTLALTFFSSSWGAVSSRKLRSRLSSGTKSSTFWTLAGASVAGAGSGDERSWFPCVQRPPPPGPCQAVPLGLGCGAACPGGRRSAPLWFASSRDQ